MAGGAPRAATSRCCRNLLQRAGAAAAGGGAGRPCWSPRSWRYDWGGLMSYRVGEVSPHDLRARVYFEVVDQERDRPQARRGGAGSAAREAAQRDTCATRCAERCRRSSKKFPPGTLLVAARFQPITDSQYDLLASGKPRLLASQSDSATAFAAASPCSSSSALLAAARRSLRGPLPSTGWPAACPRSSASAPWCC